MTIIRIVTAASSALLALVLGCASNSASSAAARSPSGAATPGGAASIGLAQNNMARPTEGTIGIDDRIARACDLPKPRFDFDSATIRGDAAYALSRVANCFTNGKLAGRELHLVGHADPRGTVIYNFALGQTRAGAVEQYLNYQGLPTEQMRTTSRGELDAQGTDEESWALDRRVDIVLAN